jgi:glycosyltransferase involved in cell wall biosynthesis
MQAPRVSFVVTCYNYARYVADAVESLLGQTFDALEVIVINDCSTDNSREVLERYSSDPRVRVINHDQNQGHIRSYNEGIGLARGEFVGVMSADDFCARTDAIAKQVAAFDADPKIGFVYTGYVFADESGSQSWVKMPWPTDYSRPGFEEFQALVLDNYVPHSGTLVRRSCHTELGYYDPRLPHAGDWDMWLRLCTRYAVAYVAEPLYAYRIHAVNMHHSKVKPRQETDEHVLTVRKAFDALPAGSPDDVRRLRLRALQRAWLRSSAVECSSGRTRRAWQAISDALVRSPDLALAPVLYAALAKTLVLTLLGHKAYVRLAARKGRRRNVQARLVPQSV